MLHDSRWIAPGAALTLAVTPFLASDQPSEEVEAPPNSVAEGTGDTWEASTIQDGSTDGYSAGTITGLSPGEIGGCCCCLTPVLLLAAGWKSSQILINSFAKRPPGPEPMMRRDKVGRARAEAIYHIAISMRWISSDQMEARRNEYRDILRGKVDEIRGTLSLQDIPCDEQRVADAIREIQLPGSVLLKELVFRTLSYAEKIQVALALADAYAADSSEANREYWKRIFREVVHNGLSIQRVADLFDAGIDVWPIHFALAQLCSGRLSSMEILNKVVSPRERIALMALINVRLCDPADSENFAALGRLRKVLQNDFKSQTYIGCRDEIAWADLPWSKSQIHPLVRQMVAMAGRLEHPPVSASAHPWRQALEKAVYDAGEKATLRGLEVIRGSWLRQKP